MKCDECERKATVFYSREEKGGEIVKMAFCEAHAAEKGVADPQSVMMMDFMEAFQQGGDDDSEVDFSDLEDLGESCPACGFTLDSLRKIGRLGCPECYVTFSEELGERLSLLHRGLVHAGKSPEGSAGQREVQMQLLGELEEELREAVQVENFEEAGRLKEEIAKVRAEMEKSEKKGGKK